MNLKNTLKEWLTFSKRERVAIIFLLPLIVGIAFLPFLNAPPPDTPITGADSAWLDAANALQQQGNGASGYAVPDRAGHIATPQNDETGENHSGTFNGRLFYFDPNTLDATGFQKLGLRNKTIQTLLNYRNKGGHFKKPDDLRKIYGLREDEFQRLKPFISIGAPQKPVYSRQGDDITHPAPGTAAAPTSSKPRYSPKIIEINHANIPDFESLYGIGNKLANRIINYRNKLGGFYTVDQVGETYGVPDTTFQKIKAQLSVNANAIQRINLNTAGYEELNNHPYISGRLAYLILKEKKEKGPFTDLTAVQPLIAQTSDSYEKVIRYLRIE